MSIVVKVVRGAGDKVGSEVIEGLASTESGLVSRGLAEIESAGSHKLVSFSCAYRPELRKGGRIAFYDTENAVTMVGMVVNVAHDYDGEFLSTSVELEVPLE